MKSILRILVVVVGILVAIICESNGVKDPAGFWFMGAIVGGICGLMHD